MYSGIPLEAYHGDICAGPSLSTTGAKTLLHGSPEEFYDTSYLNPERGVQDETSPLIFGRAIHHLILGEPHFQRSFAEQPATYEDEKTGEIKKWNGNAHACKRWEAARAKENRYILTAKEIEQIRGIAKKLATNIAVQQGILNGLVERSLFWQDKETGIWLKQRPDVIPTDSGDVADIKTITSVDWDDLRNQLYQYGYFQQAAMCKVALKEVLDIEMQSFTLFFIEKTRPFSPRPVIVKDIDIEIGMQCNRAAIDLMAKCLNEKHWPGPGSISGDPVEYIEMTIYHKNRVCRKLALLGYPSPDYEGKQV
jgi:hypothetical protein